MRAGRLHQFCSGLHVHRGFHRAHIQFEVGFRHLIGLHHHVLTGVLLEAGRLHLHRISADQQIWEYVRAGTGGDGALRHPCGWVRDLDLRVPYDCAGRICHRAAQRPIESLCIGRAQTQHQQQCDRDERSHLCACVSHRASKCIDWLRSRAVERETGARWRSAGDSPESRAPCGFVTARPCRTLSGVLRGRSRPARGTALVRVLQPMYGKL